MIVDQENHVILNSGIPNKHQMITGSSGYGKSYYVAHHAEQCAEEGSHVIILDTSNSYTTTELKKHGFHRWKKLTIYDKVGFILNTEDPAEAASIVHASLVEAFDITSYHQRGTLLQACEALFVSAKGFTFPWLTAYLEYEHISEEDGEIRSNIRRLLTKLQSFGDYTDLVVSMGQLDAVHGGAIQICQLSGMPEHMRAQATAFLLKMLWTEIRSSDEGSRRCDVLILDEIQNLPLSPSSALYSMIRESRKFDLELVLATQFLTGFSAEAQNALMLCGVRLFFHPTSQDLVPISQILSEDHHTEWRKILRGLERGEAVLAGEYRVEGGTRTSSLPIKVIIRGGGDVDTGDSIILEAPDFDDIPVVVDRDPAEKNPGDDSLGVVPYGMIRGIRVCPRTPLISSSKTRKD